MFLVYIYYHPRTDPFRFIRTHQCGPNTNPRFYHSYIYIYIYIRGASCWGWSPGLSVRKISYRAQTTKMQTIQIATFNIRTLNIIGQLPELTASAVEHKIDIICIQEHRYTHPEDIKYHETGNGWMLVTVSAWKNSVNASVGGVGMLIGPRALKTLNSMERIQPRMMAATFNGNPKATIISCYSPTNVSEETELVTFYEELFSLVRNIPKHNLLVIGGDMNARIGKNRNKEWTTSNWFHDRK